MTDQGFYQVYFVAYDSFPYDENGLQLDGTTIFFPGGRVVSATDRYVTQEYPVTGRHPIARTSAPKSHPRFPEHNAGITIVIDALDPRAFSDQLLLAYARMYPTTQQAAEEFSKYVRTAMKESRVQGLLQSTNFSLEHRVPRGWR